MDKEQTENINPLYPEHSTMPALVIKNIVQLLQQHSITTTWEQSFRCPCIDVQTGQPQPNCNVCHGQGWIYLHPRKLDMAIQGDKKSFSLAANGIDQQGVSQATPQVTVNGVEQGIKPGDRITVDGWTTNDTYTFNVTSQRLKNGIFLPFKVESINEAFYIVDGELEQLDIDGNFELKDNHLSILSQGLINTTISLSLEIIKRFYVVSMSKELRYEQYYKLEDKLWALGNGTGDLKDDDLGKDNGQDDKANNIIYEMGNNIIISDDNPDHIISPRDLTSRQFPQVIKKDGARVVLGKHQVYRLPPLLLLKRENLYFSNINVISSETDNHSIISDPRASDMSDFLTGD